MNLCRVVKSARAAWYQRSLPQGVHGEWKRHTQSSCLGLCVNPHLQILGSELDSSVLEVHAFDSDFDSSLRGWSMLISSPRRCDCFGFSVDLAWHLDTFEHDPPFFVHPPRRLSHLQCHARILRVSAILQDSVPVDRYLSCIRICVATTYSPR